jgi:hypothetical protein
MMGFAALNPSYDPVKPGNDIDRGTLSANGLAWHTRPRKVAPRRPRREQFTSFAFFRRLL